ncbi:hypothetical protein TorRG33x02_341960 [Trema orientale]|uniref:Uncharacterized protein n=1 Tax=Trema orientale TaxID=63057 RepID=A0A2P5AT30_TREOI|nr:hypothetical protein TorRG33x02_341960 [Trema orientale]
MEHDVDGVGQNASRNHVVEMEVHNFHLLLEKVKSTKEEFSALRGEIHAYVEDFRVRQMEILEALAEIREMVKVLPVRNADRRDDAESNDSSGGGENDLGVVEDGSIESNDQNDHV